MNISGRISTSQRFELLKNQILTNQGNYFSTLNQLNSGKKITNSYQNPQAAQASQAIRSDISRNGQAESSLNQALSELELGESSLSAMKEIIDRIKENAISGGSDTVGDEERINLGKELRLLGESLIQLSNTKSGNKFLFSGMQSDLATITLSKESSFNTFEYKERAADLGERKIDNIQSSISLFDALAAPAEPAKITGSTVNPTVTGSLKLVINDGNNNTIDVPEMTFAADNITTVVNTINTQFNAAGGVGSIASQDPPGQLSLDTSLMTNSIDNEAATIIVDHSTLPTALNDLGINVGSNTGKSAGMMFVLADLESAYNSNDASSIRSSLVDLDSNLDEIVKARARLGATVNRIESRVGKLRDDKVTLASNLGEVEDISQAEAVGELTLAQNALQASLQTSNAIFGQNIFDFLSF